jgi:hypothetical protein
MYSIKMFIIIIVMILSTVVFAENSSEVSGLEKAIADISQVNNSGDLVECATQVMPNCNRKSISTCLKGEGGKTCLTQCNVEPSEKYCQIKKLDACIKGEGGAPCYKKYCKGSSNTGKFIPTNISDNRVNQALPHSGYGFECYDDGDRNVYGTSRTVQRMKELGRRVYDKIGLKVFVGEMSKKGGGYLPPHSTHQTGNDVDIANMGRTDSCESYAINDGCYNRSAMKTVLEEAIKMGGVDRILFNDEVIARQLNAKYGHIVSWARGHGHHAHISWK